MTRWPNEGLVYWRWSGSPSTEPYKFINTNRFNSNLIDKSFHWGNVCLFRSIDPRLRWGRSNLETSKLWNMDGFLLLIIQFLRNFNHFLPSDGTVVLHSRVTYLLKSRKTTHMMMNIKTIPTRTPIIVGSTKVPIPSGSVIPAWLIPASIYTQQYKQPISPMKHRNGTSWNCYNPYNWFHRVLIKPAFLPLSLNDQFEYFHTICLLDNLIRSLRDE